MQDWPWMNKIIMHIPYIIKTLVNYILTNLLENKSFPDSDFCDASLRDSVISSSPSEKSLSMEIWLMSELSIDLGCIMIGLSVTEHMSALSE